MIDKMKTSLFKSERNHQILQLYRDFDFRSPRLNDPVQVLNQFQKPEEIEIAALISSALAFGKIELFKPVIQKILDMGKGDLKQFVIDFNLAKDRKLFKNLYYRIWTGNDLLCLILALQHILTRYGSLQNLFLKFSDPSDPDLENAMNGFSEEFTRFNPSPVYGVSQFSRSFKVFVPSPRSGSACKRLCLFLRWMVRKDDIDKGIWRSLSPASLIIPLDTHIYRLALFLKLTRLRTPGWKMAKEITQSLKQVDPGDPLKFDFPLCHFSIQNRCLSEAGRPLCSLCSIRKKCYFGGLKAPA